MSDVPVRYDGETARIMLEVLRCIHAGAPAEDHLTELVGTPEDEAGGPFSQSLRRLANWLEGSSVAPGSDRLRRASRAADEFAAALDVCAINCGDHRLRTVATDAAEWTGRLGADQPDVARVYNEVRAALAELHKVRTQLVMGRR